MEKPIRRDTPMKAKNHPKKPGHGNEGDYKKKRKTTKSGKTKKPRK